MPGTGVRIGGNDGTTVVVAFPGSVVFRVSVDVVVLLRSNSNDEIAAAAGTPVTFRERGKSKDGASKGADPLIDVALIILTQGLAGMDMITKQIMNLKGTNLLVFIFHIEDEGLRITVRRSELE